MLIEAEYVVRFEGRVKASELKRMRHNGWRITSVDKKDVIGTCEGCGKLLFDETDTVLDCEGTELCMECAESLRKESNEQED
jgi:hypothetical protein